MTTIGNSETIIAGRHVPLSGTERHRARSQAVAGRILPNELVTTSDQRRVWFGPDHVSGGLWHGNIATQAAMLALNTSSPRGCWPGDMCYRSDLATVARVLTNNGGALVDWILFPINTGPAGANGWSPVLANEADGERRVLQVTDWTGGSGTKPATGYIGASGLVALISNGVDIRGQKGETGEGGGAVDRPYLTFETFT